MYFGTSPSPRPGSGCCVKQAIAQDRDRCQTGRQEAEETGRFARNRWALFCSVAEEQEEGRQVEGHLQSLNLGEGLNVGHEGGIHRGSGAMIGQTLPGWADVCTLPLCNQSEALLRLHFLYATGTHRVHWPTYSRGPPIAYQNWRR